jgi:leucyl aminopeptidase
MDFELKTLSRARVAAEKCDALVVLVPEQSPTEADLISALIGHALKQALTVGLGLRRCLVLLHGC